jgi:hypothetical protein
MKIRKPFFIYTIRPLHPGIKKNFFFKMRIKITSHFFIFFYNSVFFETKGCSQNIHYLDGNARCLLRNTSVWQESYSVSVRDTLPMFSAC